MKHITRKEALELEGYALALQDLLTLAIGSNTCAKIYDPLTVTEDGKTMMSYAYNLKEGGRHHSVENYQSLAEIKEYLLKETFSHLAEDAETLARKIQDWNANP